MAPNPRVARAFRAMRDLGIPEEKVKPVLKKLLKLYDKNWELIEEENYRALADAIFDTEEAEVAESKKKSVVGGREEELEDEAQMHDEPERPLKRLRLRHQDVQASPSVSNSSPNLGGILLKGPKEEEVELPETSNPNQGHITESPGPNLENVRADSESTSPQPLNKNKGKQAASSNSLLVQESSDPSQLGVLTRSKSNSISSMIPLRDRGMEPLSPQIATRGKEPVSPKISTRGNESFSGQIANRGKEPVSPQIAAREKGSTSERSSTGVCLKEPKVEPGIIHLPKLKVPETHALIKPKDEPFTDDGMPQFEVPIAVIHPDSLPEQDSSTGNGLISEPHDESLPKSACSGDKNGGVPASSSETRINGVLTNILNGTTDNLEIASSSFGEVKISLNYSSALRRADFHIPSLDAVLKLTEDKCLKSYKVLDSSFSVMKLMKDMCECFLELGTDCPNDSQDNINGTLTIGLLKKPDAADTLDARNMPADTSNESIQMQFDAEETLIQIPIFPSPCNDIDYHTQSDKDTSGQDREREEEKNSLENANSQSLVVVEQHQLTPTDICSLHYTNDIAKGEEKVIISLVNEINNECPPSFHYIPQNVVFQNAYVNYSLARIGDDNCCSTCFGDCLLSSTPCACAHETGGEFVYTVEGLVKQDFLEECISMNRDPQKHCLFYCKDCPLERSKDEEILEPCKGHLVRRFIKECWLKCGCSKQCGNRVVQRGISHKLQVFMTPGGKGWGLRTIEDLPKGAFVCEYVGEVLTNAELYDRISHSPNNEEHAYPVLLDADWGSEVVLKDEEALCLDATYYGNVARFINHRCFDSNLVEIPVEVETPDHHYYRLAFFTTRKVKALEELTWDYGIDFDDHDHPVKAFRCRCGSKFCRNIKRSSRSRSAASRR